MPNEAPPIDATNMPDVSRLVDEVNRTGRPRLIHAGGNAARLSPARPARHSTPRRPTPEDIKASLAALGSWKGLVDAEQLKRDLDEARSSDSTLPEFTA